MYQEIFWASLAFARRHELLTVAYRGLPNYCFSITYCEKNHLIIALWIRWLSALFRSIDK